MKRKVSVLILLVAFVIGFYSLLNYRLPVQAATIKLNATSVNLHVGRYRTLSVKGTSKKVTWSSLNKSIAVVSSGGRVTAKAPGTTTIVAKVAGKKLTAKVTVKKAVTLNISKTTLEVGKTTTLKVLNAFGTTKWSTSKSSVATVSSSGKVTAKGAGKATIYANVDDRKLSAEIVVTTPITLNKTSVTLDKGQIYTLKINGTTNKVTWSTSKSSVATVSSSGKVTAKAAGTATITASVAGKKLTSKITVKEKASKEEPVAPKEEEKNTTDSKYRKVGYYAAWARYSGFSPAKLDPNSLTHINYAFANIGSDLKITLGYPDIDEKNIQELNDLKKRNSKLKTLIAVGGWSWSAKFSDAALTDTSRKTFADSIVDFIVKYGFDGVDIDWEYPVSGGLSTNGRRPEDKQNFTLLMKLLREKLDARGAKDGKQYLLTFAGAAGEWYLNNIEPGKLGQYVDYVNLMTYDFHGTWEDKTDFVAPLYVDTSLPGAAYKAGVASSIEAWIKSGISKAKLNMGIPFYGYIYKSVAATNDGLNQTYSGGASISYANIAANYLKDSSYTRFFHPISKAPWLFNGSTFITYEDEESIAHKAEYIRQLGLGGAMIWEISQDSNSILLKALMKELNR